MQSIQKKLSQVRKPRIHITYDVETEGSVEKKELPFVVGVMGDFSGNNPKQARKPFKERKFTQIDPDNFDEVMSKISPGVNLSVNNTLVDDNTEMKLELNFNTMEDFEPHKIAQQVPALKNLLETRKKLTELLSKADISEDLEQVLEDILKNPENLKKLSDDLNNSTTNKPEENR